MINSNIKILIAYHKPDMLFKNDYLIPIHVGRAVLRQKEDEESRKNLSILEEQMIGDDTGENISEKNPSYNEMTALYWAWKNYDKLGSPSYIGLMHYRRHFCIKKMGETAPYFECDHFDEPDAYIREELGLSEEALEELLQENDFITVKPHFRSSVYEHYRDNHKIEELDHAIRIVKEKFPRYYKPLRRYIHGNDTYFCNMFVFPKDIFFEYCEFVFGVLRQYEAETDIAGKRLFISERLTGAFIRYLLDTGKKGAAVPTMFLEERSTIPVAFATDLNFVVPTFAAITSLLENAKPSTFYDIHILADGSAAEFVREQSVGFEKRYQNFRINVIDMGKEFSGVPMTIGHITPTTYYRLQLPKILKDYGKCLYLDSDVAVQGDLSELYRSNIDDYYVAGVRAAGYYYPEKRVQTHTLEVGLPSIEQYINAGVLLLNLARLRNEKVCEKMLAYVGKGFSSQDQDIINLVCYNNIKILPPKYNLMTKYLRYENGKIVFLEENSRIYGAYESEEALERPIIIHYADKVKPWEDSSIIFFEEWMRCAKLSPLYKERSKSKVAVIVPIYNMEQFLGESLDSIFSQTLREIEVICINDGSQDNSLQLLFEYQKKHANLFIINQKNKGVATAINAGLDFANSEFVCFMAPDDFYPETDILETLYENAVKNNVKICGGSCIKLNEADDMTCRKTECIGEHSDCAFRQNGIVEYKDYQFDFGYHRFLYSLEMIRENDIRFPLYSCFQAPPFFVNCMSVAQYFYAMEKIVYCYRSGQQQDIYQGKKLRDFLLGNIDILRLSAKYGFAHLHRITFERLNTQMADLLYEKAISGDGQQMLELLVQVNTSIDRVLLRQELPSITENTILVPLQKALQFLSDRAEGASAAAAELDSVLNSLSFRIGRKITYLPRRARDILRGLRDRHRAAAQLRREQRALKRIRRENPLISIVISMYNAEKYLAQCLNSLLSQTYRNIEIICVDDGSTDGTRALVERYAQEHANIKILHQKHGYAGVARNYGFTQASGKYTLFLDSDDFFEPDFVYEMLVRAERERAEITVCRCRGYDQRKGRFFGMDWSVRSDYMPSANVFGGKDIADYLCNAFVGWAWDKLYRTEFIRKSGLRFQDTRSTNDAYFVFTSLALAKRITVLDRILINQRRNMGGSISQTLDFSWNNGILAADKIYEDWNSRGIYRIYERAFCNWFVHFMLWQHNSLCEPYREKLRQLIIEKAEEYNIFSEDKGGEYYYKKNEFADLAKICGK